MGESENTLCGLQTLECKVKTIKYFKGLQETQLRMLQVPMEGYSGGLISRSASTASLSATATLARNEARGTRLSAHGVMDAAKRSGMVLGDASRSVTSVEAAAAVRSIRESMAGQEAAEAVSATRAAKREREEPAES